MPKLTAAELQAARVASGRLSGRPRKPTVEEARQAALEELVPPAIKSPKAHLGDGNPVAGRRARTNGGRPMIRGAACVLVSGLVLLAGGPAAALSSQLAAAAFLQQGDKLTGGGVTGSPGFGFSVALAGDGNTALVGGPSDDGERGAAWVFTRSGSTWSQQGAKLTGSGETGTALFAWSVALSSDGKTALVGGPRDDGNKGAAWVFTRSGNAWNQEGEKLVGAGGTGLSAFGRSLALSSDGSTALVGGASDGGGKGALWVFTRSGTTWTQQGPKLVGAGETGPASLGSAVALSADGSTALGGGRGDNSIKGALWIYTRSGTTWTQQGDKLTGAGETGTGELGAAVALSADGSTALGGGRSDDGGKGALWIYTRSGTTWTQQGPKLTAVGAGATSTLGSGVALSADGSTALAGGMFDDDKKGAAWVFTRSGTTWTQQSGKLTGAGETGNGELGYSMASSSDARTALAGGPDDSGAKGAAWVFNGAPPRVSELSPASGSTAGGTLVTIRGLNFTGATAVKFGGADATLTKAVSDTEISAVAPARAAGTVDVTITSPTGTSAIGAKTHYTYTAAAAPPPPTTTTTTNPIVARIVYARVITQRGARTLDVRVRVSVKATAKLRLLRKGLPKLQKTFPVNGGPNELKALIPAKVANGSHQVEITLTDGCGNKNVYKTTVLVPA